MQSLIKLYVKATRNKWRWSSDKGSVSIEQLWELPMTSLNRLLLALDANIAKSGESSYLDSASSQTTELKEKREIALNVLNTIKAERSAARERIAKKAEREKLLAIKAKRQEESLDKMSDEELDARLAEVS